jgi:hypothetical protein
MTNDPVLREEPIMTRRLPLIAALAALLLATAATPVLANIHPIQSSECAAASGSDVANTQNPPGQFGQGGSAAEAAFFAGTAPATGSLLRALIATGVILVDENGFFAGVDFTRPALNGSSGAAKCPNA